MFRLLDEETLKELGLELWNRPEEMVLKLSLRITNISVVLNAVPDIPDIWRKKISIMVLKRRIAPGDYEVHYGGDDEDSCTGPGELQAKQLYMELLGTAEQIRTELIAELKQVPKLPDVVDTYREVLRNLLEETMVIPSASRPTWSIEKRNGGGVRVRVGFAVTEFVSECKFPSIQRAQFYVLQILLDDLVRSEIHALVETLVIEPEGPLPEA